MSRSKWWLAPPTGLALLAVGCAHCDTCDDFPRSHSARNIQGSYTPWAGEVATANPTASVIPMTAPAAIAPAPVVSAPTSAAPGPFTPTSDAAPLPPESRATPATAREKVEMPAAPPEDVKLPDEVKSKLPAEPPLSPPPANPLEPPIETPPGLD